MTTLVPSIAERNRQKRLLVDQAVKLAMQNEWQQAIEVNERLMELLPDEPDAWNRKGKALSELGRYAEARDAYQEALNRDPINSIALKQHKRLSMLAEATPTSQADSKTTKLDAKLLIEETGKTGIFELVSPAAAKILARMTPGDKVDLEIDGSDVMVKDLGGQRLGKLPPKIAVRLLELMNGGNEYVAGVTHVSERGIRVLVREMRQAPAMDGRVSFPSRGGSLPSDMRAYTKDRAVRFDLDDDLDTSDEEGEETEEADAETEETTSDIEYYEDPESSNPDQ